MARERSVAEPRDGEAREGKQHVWRTVDMQDSPCSCRHCIKLLSPFFSRGRVRPVLGGGVSGDCWCGEQPWKRRTNQKWPASTWVVVTVD